MKKFTATLLFWSLFLNLFADELVMINTSSEKEIQILSQLENLTVNYLGNGFIVGTKTGIVKQEFVLIENNAWQPGQNYFLVFVNKTKNSSYITGIESYSQILYQTEELTFIRVSDQKLSEVSPPVDGSLTKIMNIKVKLPTAKIFFLQSKSEPDPFIVARMAEVNTTQIQSNLLHLQNYGTRNAYNAQSVVAQNWIKAQFESYGLSTQLFDFTMPGGPASDNVIATKTGTLYPDEYVIIGGHYDSYAGSSGNPAPGADDNASGTCGVLEVARILAPYDFDRTIIFCAFSGEEYGLYGSAAYATWCDNNNLNILGYLNMDMIGYLKAGDPIHTDIIAPPSAQPLVDFYTSVVNLYLPTFIIEPGMLSGGDSDHTSFNNHGFMGIFPFEDSQYYSPYIHTANDLIGQSVNNFTQVGVFTKAILATTVSLANLVPVSISVNPLSFEATLSVDETETMQMNISNSGDPNLNYSITKQFIEPGKAPLAYCTSIGGGSDEYIQNVTFGSINNSTGQSYYADYTTLSTSVDIGLSYPITIVNGDPTWPTDQCGIWIDWNQNENFTDDGTITVNGSPGVGPYTATIVPPENALPGPTRMRVQIIYSATPNPCQASFSYGEVEDYTVIVNESLYSWLTVSPTSGTVAGQGTTPISVTFNSVGLEEGDYYANLKIYSNDPDEPMVTVPCTLHVANQISVDVKAMMEGPFAGTEMQTSMNTYGMLPLNQPFNTAPWTYSGTESVTVIPNANVVDWVLVELRDATSATVATSATRIARQAAFILKDGSIVGTDGSSILQFNNSINQQLFVVIYHRNHLGVLSANALLQVGGVYMYNFSSPAGQAFGTDAQKQLVNNIWGMISGDANADGTVGNNDFDPFWIDFAGEQDYSPFDLNLDGQINNVDKDSYWIPNLGDVSSIPQ